MSHRPSNHRILGVLAALVASAAMAQPTNDLCTSAETIAVAAPGVVTTSGVALIQGSAAGLEAPFSCFTTSKNSVWYRFDAPAYGSYRVDTCNGSTNYDTVIQMYAGNDCGGLTTIGTNACNDQGGSTCTPSNSSALTLTLAPGRYYVQVAAYTSVTIGATTSTALNVSYTVPAPPQTPNDVCSGATQLTPSATAGTVVSAPQVNAFTTGAFVETAQQCVATARNDLWYSFVPAVSGPHRVDTCGASNYDTTLALFTGSCGALVPVSGACNNDGSCTPSTASALTANLVAGVRYYAQVGANASPVSTSTSGLNVTRFDAHPLDQCSVDSPQLQLGRSVTALWATPDAGFAPALDDARLAGAACFSNTAQTDAGIGQTTTTASGRDIAYQFRAPTSGRYSFRVWTPTVTSNAVLYLTDSCQPVTTGPNTYNVPQCISAANRTSSDSEQVSCVQLSANQNVFVWIDESTASTAGSAARLEVTPCVLENEPNDTPPTANALSCAPTGMIAVSTDVDFYALGAHGPDSRVFAMIEGGASANQDFDLRVTTDTQTLEYDDADLVAPFGGLSSVIAGRVLSGLPAYLRVNYYNASSAAEPYVLYSVVQQGAPTFETEPNDTFASATTSATNYFSGTITDGGLDVDVYRFSANEGEVIFAALDPFPDRADAGGSPNFGMSLLDSTNAVLLTVNESGTSVTNTAGTTLTATTPTAPGEGLVWRAQATGDYAVRVFKSAGSAANAYHLSLSVGCQDLAPTLAQLSPVGGSPSGNELVTLTGTNFSTRSVVRFGGNVAQLVSATPTSIVVRSPASASSGEVAVSVTNGPGLVATLDPGFTYEDPPGIPPTLAAINPQVGPITGGTTVTLTGTVFRADAGVFFDVGGTVVPAASVTVNTAARITAVTPPHAVGTASVTVINFDGLQSTLPNAFTFQGPPTVSSITPNNGLTTGGTTITIVGTNLRAGTTVRIGGTLGTSVTIAADGLSLTANTPSSTVNTAVDVLVTTTDGQSATVTGGFTYRFPAPTVSAISPNLGTTLGGTAVAITGTAFRPNPTVTIGGTPATSVVRVSATSITAVAPPGMVSQADVVVTNDDAQSGMLTGGFRYIAPPQLASISPSNGPTQGGTLITVTGQDFLQGAGVTIGGVPAFAVTVTSPTTATAVTNAGAAGAVDVVLTNFDGQRAILTGAFTYDPAPSLASISPVTGSTAGGTPITIIGTGFLAGARVFFGAGEASSVTRVSATELTAVTAPAVAGVVTVRVQNTDGQATSLDRAFRFVAPPTVASLAPSSGDVRGGTVVTITGTGFAAGTSVSFGGEASTNVAFVSATELEATTPAHAPGAVDVEVSVNGASATLTGGFTFTRGAPTLTAVAPLSGPIAGGTLLTLSGSGFAQGATVTVGGTPATDVVVVSDVLARAVAPAHAAGAVDVVITNDDAQAATLANAFTYVTPSMGESGTVTDGGSGAVGADPVIEPPVPGGVSCGCSSFDASSFSMAGLGLLMVLSRRRRRS